MGWALRTKATPICPWPRRRAPILSLFSLSLAWRSMAEAPAGGAAEAHCESYPSTPHLPFSPEVHSDDTVLCDEQGLCFASGDIVVTEKLDGGNCCIHQGRVYARTHAQEATHRSFGPIKALAATLCGAWDSDLAFFGENMTGIHSIEYKNLTSYFYLFAVRRADGHWLPWAAVEQHAERLGLPTVPVLFKGRIPSLQDLRGLMDRAAQSHSAVGLGVKPEGFVVRAAGGFSDAEFPMAVAKYVRKGHVQTDDDWRRTWRKAALGAPCAPPPEHVAGSPDMAHASSDAAGPEAVGTSDRDHPAQPPAPAAPSPSPTPASGGSEEGPGKGAGAECASSSAKAGQRPSKLQLPKFVMLVGLPGSGKSTFGKLLLGGLSGGPQQWHHICQDEAGSRDACEAQLGHCAKDRNAHIILDRCNAEAQDRKDWLALAWKPKGAVAVFFDVPAALCRERVARRRDHPTIPEGMGGRIVESFAKKLQRPQVSEGFKEVHVVSSAEDCARLLATRFGVQVAADAIGADAALFKFPRTHHLIDVGGAVSRDDLVMTGDEILPWLGPVLTVEEKVSAPFVLCSCPPPWARSPLSPPLTPISPLRRGAPP